MKGEATLRETDITRIILTCGRINLSSIYSMLILTKLLNTTHYLKAKHYFSNRLLYCSFLVAIA